MDMASSRSERERTPFGQRMFAAREHAGLTQTDVSEALSIGQSTIVDIESKSNGSRYTARLAALYKVPALWAAEGAGPAPDWADALPKGDKSRGLSLVSAVKHPPRYAALQSRTDVPVRITARSDSAGSLNVVNNEAAGVVEAPAAGPSAFAIRMAGDALYPAVKHGMFVLCDPGADCVPGEPVLIELVNGQLQLRELMFDRAEEVTTLSLLGGHRETIARAQIASMVAVIGQVYPSKWREAPNEVGA